MKLENFSCNYAKKQIRAYLRICHLSTALKIHGDMINIMHMQYAALFNM